MSNQVLASWMPPSVVSWPSSLRWIMGLFSNKSFQRIYTIILVVGCMAFALPLLAHAYNGIFMRLNGDEYCYLAVQSQHGFWGTQWYSYQSVSGLYNGNRFSLNFALAVLGELGPRL